MLFYIDENLKIIEWAPSVVAEVNPIFEPFECNYKGEPIGFDIYVGF